MTGKDDKKKFSSFKDLAAQRGEGQPKPATPEPKFRFISDFGPERAIDDIGEAQARERIARRPAAFDAMAHGPRCYADVESEEMQILASFRVRTVFPDDVRREVAGLPRDPTAEDKLGRLDLRAETIFTIDGDDAQDFDDAISIKALPHGAYEVGVHIADVAHYVRPETALDAEALARATSIYLPDQVVPMLPEELSNHLCSLVEGRDRLTYSVTMTFDAAGKRSDARVAKSVIRSVKRNTYRVVQELLDGVDSPETQAIAHLREPLEHFRKWTVRQQQLRDAKGSMRMQSRERRFEFDAQGEVRAVVDYPRYFSMALIEETALAANQAVGDLFRERGLPTIYRVHKEKSAEEIEAVAKQLEEHGLRVPTKERLTGRDIGRLIRAARKKPNAEALIQRIMGLIERAVYEVHDHEDVAGHFGLARKAYLHFTSPIRRYPDLMVHRWLWSLESRPEETARELRTLELLDDLNSIAAHSSSQSEVAEMCSYALGDLKVCQFMHPHIGEKLKARVQRVSPPGLEVELVDFNVTGFLPTRAIGERGEVKGPTITIKRGREVRSFTEGHPIAVRLKDVDFLKLSLFLELA
ncbi:MAG: RNB domain-containing ribonuclease [Planctomycetes bacterium]|nr:RNB domain-containing ribonuclease [Planctomycetota bacterium]